MYYLITYKKEDGTIFTRLNKNIYKEKGERTSMGWLVLDIHVLKEDGNWYHRGDYEIIQRFKRRKSIRKKAINKIINCLTKLQ